MAKKQEEKNYDELKAELEARCKKANIELEEEEGIEEDETCLRLGFQAGKEKRNVYLWDDDDIRDMLNVAFENYKFISGYRAIYSLNDKTIEANVEPIGAYNSKAVYRKLFPDLGDSDDYEGENSKISIKPPTGVSAPRITLGPPSKVLKAIVGASRLKLTIKITNAVPDQHDKILNLLQKIGNALFFQIDMLIDIPLQFERERRRLIRPGKLKKQKSTIEDVNYPESEYDEAPISLYWYGKSAVGMPLLQFLAFYQVIEFYFPIYFQAETRRRLAAILKDPTFRNDRDSDLGRVINVLRQNRSGGLGDERSQLHATLNECIDPDALREFVISNEEMKTFLSSKAKGLTDHKLPIANESLDLRNDVADRIYDIRCKIVHTKSNANDGEFELLLPFSKEAEQLKYDIDLIHFLAQKILISASTPLQINL